MAVDEFGREIPAARDDRRSPSPHHHHSHHYERNSGLGPGAPSLLYEALPSSRNVEERGREQRDHRGDRDRHYDERHVIRKRKNHSESPPPSSFRRGGGGNSNVAGNSNRDGRGNSSGGASINTSKTHPSYVYAEDPMLCHHLWKEAHEGKSESDYDEYRKAYCLNYVRTFFNEHMDDSWFRSLYSPLERYKVGVQEKKRASQEAKAFLEELDSSIAKQGGANRSTIRDPSFFVLKARLGNGIRQTGWSDYQHSSSQKSSQGAVVNPIPETHVISLSSQVLHIQKIPPHVTDDQLTTALMQHSSSKVSPDSVTLYSGSIASDLTRTAFLYAPEEVRKEIVQHLHHLDRGGPASAPSDGSHVPRKEDTYLPKTLELEVECSDAYGRSEVDVDGKGGEPEERGGIPKRTETVSVSTLPIFTNVQVLSAALSSKLRIQKDRQSALMLANAYDARRDIPSECRLETILKKALPHISNFDSEGDDSPLPEDVEDALDVTIAYLRRVHLLSFYNFCSVAGRFGDVLDGKHAVSTIHLRLANADEILEPMEIGAPVTDLLVQRLNDSIQKSLEESSVWRENLSNPIIDLETDARAHEIEREESNAEDSWIQDHALIDQDGRARCSFHFCRKLFKDPSFLRKHLIKKHSEFLRAEVAKCHDSYMMDAWDAEYQRPVPPILVDCGSRFGLKPIPVLGSAVPLAVDPEPELWRREQERIQIAEREAESRRERYENSRRHHHDNSAPSLDAPLSEERGQGGPRPKRNFVDIDDMKEEKVEMAFDQIEIPVQPPKKKKRKKLL